jgi:hypothetical protein
MHLPRQVFNFPWSHFGVPLARRHPGPFANVQATYTTQTMFFASMGALGEHTHALQVFSFRVLVLAVLIYDLGVFFSFDNEVFCEGRSRSVIESFNGRSFFGTPAGVGG